MAWLGCGVMALATETAFERKRVAPNPYRRVKVKDDIDYLSNSLAIVVIHELTHLRRNSKADFRMLHTIAC